VSWDGPGWNEATREYHANREGNGRRQPTGENMKADARRFTLFAELEINSTKEWLVHNLLGDGDASVMFGKPGDGKSVLAEDLGLHIAADRLWHGRKVKQGAVVFVALERRKVVERRAIAFREKHGLEDLPFAIVGGVHDFRNPKTVTLIAEIVREVEAATGQQVVLIIIDTISRALCGGDENSPKDMGAIVAATSRDYRWTPPLMCSGPITFPSMAPSACEDMARSWERWTRPSVSSSRPTACVPPPWPRPTTARKAKAWPSHSKA
jgi:AAA domain